MLDEKYWKLGFWSGILKGIVNSKIAIVEHTIEIVQEFTYLGSRVSTDNNTTTKFALKCLVAKKSYLTYEIAPFKKYFSANEAAVK